MMMRPTLTIDSADFYAALGRALETTRRDVRAATLTQFKGVARNIFRITPPMQMAWRDGAPLSSGDFAEGRNRGKTNIDADTARAFHVPTTARGKAALRTRPDSRANLSWYLSIRNARKRNMTRFRVPVSATGLRSIRKAIYARQGATASGWAPMATRFGISVPRWIKDKGGNGSARIIDNPNFFGFEAVNGTNHVDSAKIEKRIDIALRVQTGRIERSAANVSERAARRAGVGR